MDENIPSAQRESALEAVPIRRPDPPPGAANGETQRGLGGSAEAAARGAAGLSFEPDPAGYTALFTVLDRAMHAAIARYTLGLSPRAMASAYLDWLGGLMFSPGKQAQLVHKAQRKWMRFISYAQSSMLNPHVDHECCIEPLPQDHRFRDEAWRIPPFNLIYQSFLLSQQWWHNATTGVSGVTPQNERAIAFAARQWLDIFSPSNFLFTNPVVLNETLRQGGQNLVNGFTHFVEDWQTLNQWTQPGRRRGGVSGGP